MLVEEVADHPGWVGADELDELEPPGPHLRLGFQRRSEHSAGSAPGGPEVDHDRQGVRALEHVTFESLGCHIHLVSRFLMSGWFQCVRDWRPRLLQWNSEYSGQKPLALVASMTAASA